MTRYLTTIKFGMFPRGMNITPEDVRTPGLWEVAIKEGWVIPAPIPPATREKKAVNNAKRAKRKGDSRTG